MKFRKKPVVIEAKRLNYESMDEIKEWIGGKFDGLEHDAFERDRDVFLYIKTLEGTHRASYGDWIIKGIRGEFYPCKPDIFEATYEAVNTPSEPNSSDKAHE